MLKKTQELAKFNELRRNYSANMMGLVNIPVEQSKKSPTKVAQPKDQENSKSPKPLSLE